MSSTPSPPDFELPAGWRCSVEIEQAADGSYAGKAELREYGIQRCVLVIAQQPTREAALERVRFRASYFVSEWASRHAQPAADDADTDA